MARPADNPDYGARTLQIEPECKGRDVWELQTKLVAWGSGTDNEDVGNILEPMKITGTFDRRTCDAVMRFQKALGMPVTGMVDSATFRAIDREAALYPVLVHDMKCPCVAGANDGPILCRCTKHPNPGKCDGFGKSGYSGEFLLNGRKLGDDTDLSGEKLDLYNMREFPGIDKALLWAVRGLMRRAGVTRIAVLSGYRCWEDNYHHTDDLRWHHRRLTFHMGRAIEFCHDGDGTSCTERGANPAAAPCLECGRVRDAAIAKCGFQLRWQDPDRVAVAEGQTDARPPVSPFAVHVNTVRLLDRQDDDFVKTYLDSTLPLFAGAGGYSMPVDLGEGTDPKVATSETFFANTEKSPGGWFPLGVSRIWHGGIHLQAAAGAEVRAIADGQVIGFRVGESETKKTLGSRNFVLIRHEFNKKKYYSLYQHLDGEAAAANASTGWRRQVAIRTKKHVEAVAPCPFFMVVEITLPDGVTKKKRFRLREQKGLGPEELALAAGGEEDATTIDDSAPAGSTVVKLVEPADTYVFTKLDNKVLSKLLDADATAESKIESHEPGGLTGAVAVAVRAGEVIGKIGAVASDAEAAALGTYVHVELFSGEAFLTGDGWQQIDVASADKVPDRKAAVEELTAKKLLSMPPDGVFLDEDVRQAEQNVYRELVRAVILKMPCEWDLDWKAAISAPENLAFIEDRGALGDRFNEYGWWKQVAKDKADLPASSTVFHYHPIAAILAMAHA